MISLSELRRLQNALERFERKIDEAYPGYLKSADTGVSHDMSETVRNALTALAHVPGWIGFRQHNHRDPGSHER